MRNFIFFLMSLFLGWVGWTANPVDAQARCGLVNTLQFPVDPNIFHITQDFASPSLRHQGRFHSGEDWSAGRAVTFGQTVAAIASGRVTFSSPNGWGEDGGVIIIEHTFPDNSVFYSMYGHVTDQHGIAFPSVNSCVSVGTPIASIFDARPAPHLHWEIRTGNSDVPGAGYVWSDPQTVGLRRPTKFILNWQSWLRSGFTWRLDLADETGPIAPPVVLSDHSLIFIDTGRVFRASPDGRVLWRINLPRTAVGVYGLGNDRTLVVSADGTAQSVQLDGTLGESFALNEPFDAPPVRIGDVALFHTQNNELIAYTPDLTQVLWRASEIATVHQAISNGVTLVVMTSDAQIYTFDVAGNLLDQAELEMPGALAVSPENEILAYTRGGLWIIHADGTWEQHPTSAQIPAGGSTSALGFDQERRLLVFDGQSLFAFDRLGGMRWQTPLPRVEGYAQMQVTREAVLLTSSDGWITAVDVDDGLLCQSTRIYGTWRTKLWSQLGNDNILRTYVADQVIGYRWRDFLLGCR